VAAKRWRAHGWGAVSQAALAAAALLAVAAGVGYSGSRALAEAAPSPDAAQAQAAADPPSGCGSPAECFARLASAQRRIRRLEADFRQVKRVALMDAPLVSTGRFTYEPPDTVRWEVLSPEPMVVEIDARGLRAGAPGSVAEVVPAGGAEVVRDLGALFAAGDERVGDRFAVTAGDGAGSFVLEPLDPRLARVIETVELEIDPTTGVARRVVLREPGGDRTEIELEVRELVRADPAERTGSP
jgi:Outer membrane lipoprotein carrier protein LolA